MLERELGRAHPPGCSSSYVSMEGKTSFEEEWRSQSSHPFAQNTGNRQQLIQKDEDSRACLVATLRRLFYDGEVPRPLQRGTIVLCETGSA